MKKYKGDEKFARVHKRIREVNKQREDKGQKPMFSFLDEEIAAILNIIKEDVDAKVYDRNDILKKDAYFGYHRLAVVAPCGGNLYGRNQIFLTVGAQHANRQLGAGKNHRFGQVFQHET